MSARRFIPLNKATALVVTGAVGLLVLGHVAFAWYVDSRIVPNTWIGTVSVSGLTRDAAIVRVQDAFDRLRQNNIHLSVNGADEVIDPGSIGFDLNVGEAVDQAYARGRTGSFLQRYGAQLSSLWSREEIDAPVHLDQQQLVVQLNQIAQTIDTPRRDVRLAVRGTAVRLLTDTAPGKVIDQTSTLAAVQNVLSHLEMTTITVVLRDDRPVADPATGPAAVTAAQKMLARPITLQYEELQFTIGSAKIGSWITSQYDSSTLQAGIDRAKIAAYVTNIAASVDVAPEPPQLETIDGRIVGFTPARVGRAVQQDALVQAIAGTLAARSTSSASADTITIPVKSTAMGLTGLDASAGITELIGQATTPFTGSPHNRILNIKNGVRFLSGTIIQPGQEFSTLATLGTIDNTTGYLPELVIKGDRTQPEFGGGLCQVSTTLFRAVLNAGLPVTARRNHSYRVSYYEKDGNGVKIGPGLDATIYEPDTDFRFRNDTAHAVLIIGYVSGDKLTFQLYGTRDGRTSTIDGPHLLSETPPGVPKYIETLDLAPGVTKQVETPHSGGSAVATYAITYSDGRMTSQIFRSYYRPWPAQYLVGVAALSSPSPSPVP